jgi:hypothetical protein
VGLLFEPFRSDTCCLCGATENLTGEHKIKASILREEFPISHMLIVRPGQMKIAQGVKAKVFHFRARICRPCNSTRTQAVDREFDRFHRIAMTHISNGEDPTLVFNDIRYAAGSEHYLNVFRYFAKLLCCHIAEFGAPRPRHLSRFALGETSVNCVWLDINKDWIYSQAYANIGRHQYASHGGLIVYGKKKTNAVGAFHSSLTVGPLRYVFFSRLTWPEQLELRLLHQKFHDRYSAIINKFKETPLSTEELLELGLATKQE